MLMMSWLGLARWVLDTVDANAVSGWGVSAGTVDEWDDSKEWVKSGQGVDKKWTRSVHVAQVPRSRVL